MLTFDFSFLFLAIGIFTADDKKSHHNRRYPDSIYNCPHIEIKLKQNSFTTVWKLL